MIIQDIPWLQAPYILPELSGTCRIQRLRLCAFLLKIRWGGENRTMAVVSGPLRHSV